MKNFSDDIGIVVIGRNEGDRLKRCLKSVLKEIDRIVYVDSGSSDGSVEYAKRIGVDVVMLDMKIPFNAGRARNEGFSHIIKKNQNIKYIQFIDGDCEIVEGWLSFARNYLENNVNCAVVAGRRIEKDPDGSVYNMLCDVEWNTPIGSAEACGGDFMIRKVAFLQVDGFNPIVLVCEEPEMCYRLKNNNWSIFRLDHLMTVHDAAMVRFSQWWRRNLRKGHGGGQMISLGLCSYGGKSIFIRHTASMWFWAVIFPTSILLLSFSVNIFFLLLTLLYFIQFIRIAIDIYERAGNTKNAMYASFFAILGKWPQVIGQLLYIKRKLLGDTCTNIEYSQ